MENAVGSAVATVYALAALWVGLYALAQLHLLLWSHGHTALPPSHEENLPDVLVQLPIRNERRVVEALIRSIAGLDWPQERLHIQLLDDSDDETVAICAALTTELRMEGHRIQHVQRSQPAGFKAGALRHGLTLDNSPFVVIFDADFRPEPDFLRRAMQALQPGVGLVQARWAHLNREHSWFTRAQAFHLDAHFSVEQQARSRQPLMMGFNGTAGVWRRSCIDAAGGWSADTLTEDLDLAFRAQLAGWTLSYLDTLAAPAELPEAVQAIRTQQHRWMKGGAQVSRKLLAAVWRSDRSLLCRLQATAHLLGGTVFIAVLTLSLLTPMLHPLGVLEAPAGIVLQVSLVVLILFYSTMCVRREGWLQGMRRMATTFVPFLALSTGLCLHNSVAVIDGWSGRKSAFVRTPKRGTASSLALYRPQAVGWMPYAELVLSAWGMTGLLWALAQRQWILAGFLSMQAAGFALVAAATLFQDRP